MGFSESTRISILPISRCVVCCPLHSAGSNQNMTPPLRYYHPRQAAALWWLSSLNEITRKYIIFHLRGPHLAVVVSWLDLIWYPSPIRTANSPAASIGWGNVCACVIVSLNFCIDRFAHKYNVVIIIIFLIPESYTREMWDRRRGANFERLL